MADAATPAKTLTKKSTKAKKPKKVEIHPQYAAMVTAAIKAIVDKKGASRQAIVTYVVANYKLDRKVVTIRVRKALQRGVVNKAFVIVKGTGAFGRFKLKEDVKPKKTAAKKSPAKKTVAKKIAAKTTPKKPKAAKKTQKKVAKSPKAAKKSPKKKASTPKKPTVKKAKK